MSSESNVDVVAQVPMSEIRRARTRWDQLQGTEHTLDRERARLLHQIWSERLQKDETSLKAFIIGALSEYPGKRTMSFVRFTIAFDAINDETVWSQIGGRGVVLLSRLKPGQARRVMTKVRSALKDTGRSNVSSSTFRTIVLATLGNEVYASVLSERRHSDTSSLRRELAALKQFLLTLLQRQPTLAGRMSEEVRHALGLDLVAHT